MDSIEATESRIQAEDDDGHAAKDTESSTATHAGRFKTGMAYPEAGRFRTALAKLDIKPDPEIFREPPYPEINQNTKNITKNRNVLHEKNKDTYGRFHKIPDTTKTTI